MNRTTCQFKNALDKKVHQVRMNNQQNCQCSCGVAQYNVHGEPMLRGFCHCTICQEFNQASYADMTIFRAKDVIMPKEGTVEFATYRSPPAVQRGKCKTCGNPAVEFVRIPSLPKIIIVPSKNILDKAFIPEPSLHMFYNSRVADVDDNLPKYSGYWSSQVAFVHRLIASLLRGRVSA